jgi:hypothetical protein
MQTIGQKYTLQGGCSWSSPALRKFLARPYHALPLAITKKTDPAAPAAGRIVA